MAQTLINTNTLICSLFSMSLITIDEYIKQTKTRTLIELQSASIKQCPLITLLITSTPWYASNSRLNIYIQIDTDWFYQFIIKYYGQLHSKPYDLTIRYIGIILVSYNSSSSVLFSDVVENIITNYQSKFYNQMIFFIKIF